MDVATIECLVTASDSSDALYMLYRHRKHLDPRCSLAFFCKAAGITSTGYLSDVLSRRRTLHAKYRIAITKAFGLTAEAGRCLRLLVDIDNEKAPTRLRRLKARLALVRKTLKITHQPMAPELRGFLFALEVYCCFGLFRNEPTRSDLAGYFGAAAAAEIDRALALLAALKFVRPTTDDRFETLTTQIVFGEGGGVPSHIEFLKMALAHAADGVEQWFPRREQAHFASYIISVNRLAYEKLLPSIKSRILMAHAELDSSDGADMLVRFNVQLYPLGAPAAPPQPGSTQGAKGRKLPAA